MTSVSAQLRTGARRTFAALALTALAAAAAAACLGAAQSQPARSRNPHWRPDGCAGCHEIKSGKPVPIPRDRVDPLCVDCHDGTRGHKEAHPVGGLANTPEIASPAGWPTEGGKIECLTCHDVKLGCDREARRTPQNPRFLRGKVTGESPAIFCANCHKARHYPKFNPHIMLTDDGQVREDRCLFCHTKVLDRNAEERTADPALKTRPPALCRTCHVSHKDSFGPNHIGAKAPPKMQAYMAARDTIGLMGPISGPTLTQLQESGARSKRMPLDPDGTISCVTCHNPHQRRLFKPQSVLSYRAMHVVEDDRVISPVRGEQWCVHCHDM